MSPFSRTVAIPALLSAAMLASPLAAMAADSVTTATPPAAQATMPRNEAQSAMPPQTVDQRIATLHDSLKITPSEETKWDAVATAMRDNAAAMKKLAAEKSSNQADMTAVQDLQTYEKFARAHVAGLKTLTSSFETLYNAMPAAQQKNADEVFAEFGHKPATTHS